MTGRMFGTGGWRRQVAGHVLPLLFVGLLFVSPWWGCSDDSGGHDIDAGRDASPVDASGPLCGNGIREGDEECDDGNRDPGDGCDADCRSEYACGNGLLEPGEECDASELSSSCVLDGHLAGAMTCKDDCSLDSSACSDMAAGIVAWYKLDTVSPILPDATGQGHGCSPTEIQAGFPGMVAESSLFDRTQGAYADCGTGSQDATPMDGFDEMTLEAWLYLNTYPALEDDAAVVLSRNATADPEDQAYLLGVTGSSYGTMAYHALFAVHSTDQAAVGTATLLTGRWYHLAGTYRAGELTLYVNGTLDATATQDATGPVRSLPDARTFIGALNVAGTARDLFDGYLDDIKIWSQVRSADQICEDAGGWRVSDGTCTFGSE